jgi:hypothetical protein
MGWRKTATTRERETEWRASTTARDLDSLWKVRVCRTTRHKDKKRDKERNKQEGSSKQGIGERQTFHTTQRYDTRQTEKHSHKKVRACRGLVRDKHRTRGKGRRERDKGSLWTVRARGSLRKASLTKETETETETETDRQTERETERERERERQTDKNSLWKVRARRGLVRPIVVAVADGGAQICSDVVAGSAVSERVRA